MTDILTYEIPVSKPANASSKTSDTEQNRLLYLQLEDWNLTFFFVKTSLMNSFKKTDAHGILN